MANYYPANYQPMYYPSPQTTNLPLNTGIIWVQGEAGAKSYMVAPNTTVALWDSENQIIYLKSADASGMPNMKVLDYTIRAQNAPNAPASPAPMPVEDYATKADIDALSTKLGRLKADLDEFVAKQKKRREVDDE